jgi:acetyl-CoA carboxylase biotin carboxyl carrier protein
MKAKEIRDLISFISNSGLDEVNIETEEFKIAVKKNSAPAISGAELPVVNALTREVPAESRTAAAAVEQTPKPSTEDSKYVEVKSPMIGTFYDSASPEVDAFVSIGDTVKVGQTVCIIEAMKLFNEIESEYTGTVVKVLVDNASPVEYDQPLFLIDPS